MGLNEREAVALLCGGHVYGRCHPTSSGYAGAWVEEPTKFSAEYAADMVGDPWRMVTHEDAWLDEIGAGELRPNEGLRQFVNQVPAAEMEEGNEKPPNQMMLVSDM